MIAHVVQCVCDAKGVDADCVRMDLIDKCASCKEPLDDEPNKWDGTCMYCGNCHSCGAKSEVGHSDWHEESCKFIENWDLPEDYEPEYGP